ncbi:D-sedoheptulose-7-phosphate isomerase [Nonomuraea rhodomycinica]|uniref:SIS domain-containing protein n=1 Tax=Nonomuraea rhodomycinica TaxID=1712872 RepID=A0A7Y6MEX4_9ACTN|nr:SIS domain-containing protein [Nonomuraea rhodomycinica]NUW44179.1 SIS domain-containing protein [Nonomuraea rhodomycinica]
MPDPTEPLTSPAGASTTGASAAVRTPAVAAAAGLAEQVAAHVAAARAVEAMLPAVEAVGELLMKAFTAGGTLYTMGNGGSAADAQHFTGELIGHYRRDRRPLPAVTLTTDATVMTCIANDYAYDEVFARQVRALARPGDVVAAFTTSGNSPNIVAALEAARAGGAATVLFGGGDGGAAARHADHLLLAPSCQTPRIQEMHTLMLHMISDRLDAWAAA